MSGGGPNAINGSDEKVEKGKTAVGLKEGAKGQEPETGSRYHAFGAPKGESQQGQVSAQEKEAYKKEKMIIAYRKRFFHAAHNQKDAWHNRFIGLEYCYQFCKAMRAIEEARDADTRRKSQIATAQVLPTDWGILLQPSSVGNGEAHFGRPYLFSR